MAVKIKAYFSQQPPVKVRVGVGLELHLNEVDRVIGAGVGRDEWAIKAEGDLFQRELIGPRDLKGLLLP